MEESVYYLSGPMAGYPEHNFPLFEELTQKLRDKGYKIVSPHENNVPGEGQLEYFEYIKRDVASMNQCNSIIMMPGWTLSKGARIEFNLAVEMGFFVSRLVGYPDDLRVVDINDGFYHETDGYHETVTN